MVVYDAVMIGATFLSFGIAKAHTGNTLIIDPKGKPGYEFIDAFHNGSNYDQMPETQEGKNFRAHIESCGVCENIFVPEWTGYFSNWICQNQISVLLFTSILSVEQEHDYLKVTIFNTNGKSVIYTKKVIDTTTDSYCRKALNAIMFGPCPKAFSPTMDVTPHNEQYSLVSFAMPLDCTMAQAKHILYTTWENRPEDYQDTAIAATADRFALKAYTAFRKTAENQYAAASDFYDNPFLAFDQGCVIGGELCNGVY